MEFLIRKGAQFILNTGAISGAYTLDKSLKQRGVGKPCAQRVVYLGRGVDKVAGHLLFHRPNALQKRELGAIQRDRKNVSFRAIVMAAMRLVITRFLR